MDVETIQRIFVQAMASDTFRQTGTRSGEWNLAQGCEDPGTVVLWSRSTGLAKYLRKEAPPPPPGIELRLNVVCRRCDWCRKRKSLIWAYRAEREIERAPRTWFGTLTLNPDNHVRMNWIAATKIGDFWSAPRAKKFELVSREIGRELTLTLKRLRKNTGSSFRYLAVTEIHDSEKTSEAMRGNAHLHVLLHELPNQPITKRALEAEWTLGFTQWRLADKGAGWYLSKYLTKAVETRTRASLQYGLD